MSERHNKKKVIVEAELHFDESHPHFDEDKRLKSIAKQQLKSGKEKTLFMEVIEHVVDGIAVNKFYVTDGADITAPYQTEDRAHRRARRWNEDTDSDRHWRVEPGWYVLECDEIPHPKESN